MSSKNLNRQSFANPLVVWMLLAVAPATTPAADPTFGAPVNNPNGLTTLSGAVSPRSGDFDLDGDKDVLTGRGFGDLTFYRNLGNATTPNFTTAGDAPAGLEILATKGCPAMGDLNGDGDLDVILGASAGNLWLMENTGPMGFPAFAGIIIDPFGTTGVGSDSAPNLADLDSDGDLDLLVGDGSGNFDFFRNTGSPSAPAFATQTANPFGLSPVSAAAAPALADLDGDGDVDLLAGRSNGTMSFFRNTGSSTAPAFAAAVTNPFGIVDIGDNSTPHILDFDGDGDLDVLSGNSAGVHTLFRNTVPDFLPPTSSATIVAATTASINISVGFATSDPGSGVASTTLFVKTPGSGSFTSSGLTLSGSTGTFPYVAAAGNGVYEFYTVATDNSALVEPAPAIADDSIILDTIAPTIPGGIVRLNPQNSDDDAVVFRIPFSESVSPTLARSDIGILGTLSSNTDVYVSEPAADFSYRVGIILNDKELNGTVRISVTGPVSDAAGNPLAVPVNSGTYTITNFAAGDVNKDGTFDVADVAILADANLGLVVLP